MSDPLQHANRIRHDGVDDNYNVFYGSHTTDDYDNSTEVSTVKWQSSVSVNYSVEMMIVVSVLLFIVIIVTAVGNAMVGLALFRYRQLRTVSNYLIGNLALSDFLLATTIFPLSTVNEALGYWPFGRTLCHVWLTLDVLYCTASIWNLCVIAFDRFTATVFPVWYRSLRSAPGQQAAIYAVVVWTVAATVCVPPLLGWNAGDLHDFKVDIGVYNCVLFQSRGYVIYSASGSFFLPFVVTLFLYLGILIVLRGRMHKSGDAKEAASKNAARLSATNKTSKPGGEVKEICIPSTTIIKAELASTFADSCSSIVDVTTAAEVQGTSGDTTMAEDNSFYCLGIADKENQMPLIDVLKNNTTPDELQQPNDVKSRLSIPRQTGAITASKGEIDINTVRNGNSLLLVPSNVKYNANLSPPETETETETSRLQRPTFSIRSSSSFCLSPFVRRKSPAGVMTVDQGHSGHSGPDHSSVEAQQRRQRASYERREMRATIRMAIIIAFFCGFWLGFFVVYLVRGCCEECSIPRALDAFFFWLGYSNSSVNPILYTIFNDEFRGAFKKILGIGDKNKKKAARR